MVTLLLVVVLSKEDKLEAGSEMNLITTEMD